jgi:hypothetical protein
MFVGTKAASQVQISWLPWPSFAASSRARMTYEW